MQCDTILVKFDISIENTGIGNKNGLVLQLLEGSI